MRIVKVLVALPMILLLGTLRLLADIISKLYCRAASLVFAPLIICLMMGVEQAEMMGLFPVAPEDEKIYVATVPDKVHGAGVLAYQNFMDQAAERAGGDFFILPSSIHEVLIVPDNGEMGLKDLEARYTHSF